MSITVDKNCSSIIVFCEKKGFYEKELLLLQKLRLQISECITRDEVKFQSQSTLGGNQTRKDVVFNTERQARDFISEVRKSVKLPPQVSLKTFLFTEAQLGYQHQPVLSELDVLNIINSNNIRHLFRHFLTCTVFTKDQVILFRFKNISDVNLFLYFRCNDPSKRTLGMFRENQKHLKLVPDRKGRFNLIGERIKIPFGWKWAEWGEKFKFESKRVKGSTNKRHLQFESRADLFTFFAWEEAKNCALLILPEEQIIEDAFGSLVDIQLEAKAEEQEGSYKLAFKDDELIAANDATSNVDFQLEKSGKQEGMSQLATEDAFSSILDIQLEETKAEEQEGMSKLAVKDAELIATKDASSNYDIQLEKSGNQEGRSQLTIEDAFSSLDIQLEEARAEEQEDRSTLAVKDAENAFSNLDIQLEEAKGEEKEVRSQLAAKDVELIAAKVTLAKKEALFDSQDRIIRELKRELQKKLQARTR